MFCSDGNEAVRRILGYIATAALAPEGLFREALAGCLGCAGLMCVKQVFGIDRLCNDKEQAVISFLS